MLTNVDRDRHQLLRVNTDNLLHDSRQVLVFSLANDIQQLERDLPDERFDVLLRLFLGGQERLQSDGGFDLDRKILIVQQRIGRVLDGLYEEMFLLELDLREIV